MTSKLMMVLNLTSIQRVLRRHGHGDSWRGVCCPVISDDHLELFTCYGPWNLVHIFYGSENDCFGSNHVEG